MVINHEENNQWVTAFRYVFYNKNLTADTKLIKASPAQ